MISKVPLRIRLTAIFGLAMAAVLAAAGYLALSRFAESQNEYARRATPEQLLASQEAYADLRRELLTALPVVFLAATVGAYLLAAAALRPVERMRAQAAAVTDTTPHRRLQVPPGRDEIARLAATLNAMLDRLQAALEREKRFAADAGHELRTPLSLLKTELDLALRRLRTPTELTAALASAAEETQRLVDLAEDLLLLARTDQADHRPRGLRTLDLAPLLQRLTARHRNAHRTTALTVHCPAHLRVKAEPTRLERALTNLISNAFQHGRGPIDITTRETRDHVEIHVRDHGPGFPPDFLPTAFNRFTRADHARTTGGTGLGLAIVAAITRAAGGTYGAANHPDGGADVWIALPAGTPH
ncbi:HAMP domain-containing histidine kinase [Streptomyces sp. ET3-23]|uniref:HAMP domain-containing sensor histidine kinase n=1 Tax=Streptomyces sp. ET3-23 TaxID=2885643 RepID=UPI001D111FC9|nr:HAMP domain-containing sensor histidine kinase [Streptomyces sp. ET3-23]MCC2280418.1 HAMP domain-containing histidine kinase [Streptomyces sp. ET3-23]